LQRHRHGEVQGEVSRWVSVNARISTYLVGRVATRHCSKEGLIQAYEKSRIRETSSLAIDVVGWAACGIGVVVGSRGRDRRIVGEISAVGRAIPLPQPDVRSGRDENHYDNREDNPYRSICQCVARWIAAGSCAERLAPRLVRRGKLRSKRVQRVLKCAERLLGRRISRRASPDVIRRFHSKFSADGHARRVSQVARKGDV
jgi:hypothetical protein